MASLERSAALRRMGVTEWLPRLDVAAVISAVDVVAELPVGRRLAEDEVRAEPAAVPVTAAPAAVPLITSAPAAKPAVAVNSVAPAIPPATPSIPVALVPGLRGRSLTAVSDAPLLVLAMAEKSPRDTILNPDAASGALLKAMLAELPAPASVALLGVERGEPVAVPPTILVLGERSARLLLGNDVAMPLRGRVHLFGLSRVVVTYHPDELRQNSSLKRLAWDDLRLLAGLLAAASSASTGPS